MDFITATGTSQLASAIGAVSSGVFDSVYSWVLVAVGIPLAFYLAKKIISLIPKK